MKQIMIIATGLISLLTAPAFAEFTCKSSYPTGGPTVELKVEGNRYYTIQYYGQSRNTYKAIYKAPFFAFAFDQKLEKVVDLSTWNDMPNELNLSYDGGPTHAIDVPVLLYRITGLLPNQPALFNENDCIDIEEPLTDMNRKLGLNCHDGTNPISVQHVRVGLINAYTRWEGLGLQYESAEIIEQNDSLIIYGETGPRLATFQEGSVEFILKVGPLGNFAQGTYSVVNGGERIVDNKNIECQITRGEVL